MKAQRLLLQPATLELYQHHQPLEILSSSPPNLLGPPLFSSRYHISAMKVHKPNTDYELELTILANGQKCPEYVLPDAEDDPSAAVCYIPIGQDDTITIQGKFSGSILRCHVDVLADGSWVANRVIEGDERDVKNGLLTHFDKRRVDIKTFLQVPDMQERKHNMRPNVAEGNLVIKRLPPALQALQLDGGDEKTGVGVGSLTVTVSLNQQAFETYGEANKYVYYNYTLGSWRDHVSDVKCSGIKPEHEMRMEIFPGSNPIENKKATYFWRDLKGPRPGETAWAYLIFYYRTQEAIDEAGCVLRTETKALLPDKGTFMRASDQAKIPQNVSYQNTSLRFTIDTNLSRTRAHHHLPQRLC